MDSFESKNHPSEDKRYLQRYEILREMAMAGASGADFSQAVRRSLAGVCQLLQLVAARVILWSEEGEVSINVSHSSGSADLTILDELEEDVFHGLRHRRQLKTAFLTFGGASPLSAFTVPLYHRERLFGAAIGVSPGDVKLVREDFFLDALAATVSLAALAEFSESLTSDDKPKPDIQKLLDAERLKAVLETAVTFNHEINNPLTAALGNVQLILMDRDKLDPALRRKLEVVEKSATQIRDVTQRLLSLTEAKSVTYASNEKMIDISAEGDQPPKSPGGADKDKPKKK